MDFGKGKGWRGSRVKAGEVDQFFLGKGESELRLYDGLKLGLGGQMSWCSERRRDLSFSRSPLQTERVGPRIEGEKLLQMAADEGLSVEEFRSAHVSGFAVGQK